MALRESGEAEAEVAQHLVHEEHGPSDELDPDEPRTPMWMPLLGGAIFLVGGLFFMATRPPGKTAEILSQEAAAAAAKAAEAEKAAQPAEADPHAGHNHPPGQHPGGAAPPTPAPRPAQGG